MLVLLVVSIVLLEKYLCYHFIGCVENEIYTSLLNLNSFLNAKISYKDEQKKPFWKRNQTSWIPFNTLEYHKIQNLIDHTKIYVEAEVPNVETNPLLRHDGAVNIIEADMTTEVGNVETNPLLRHDGESELLGWSTYAADTTLSYLCHLRASIAKKSIPATCNLNNRRGRSKKRANK